MIDIPFSKAHKGEGPDKPILSNKSVLMFDQLYTIPLFNNQKSPRLRHSFTVPEMD